MNVLKKPVKIEIVNMPNKPQIDYEFAGQILDNFIIKAENEGLDIEATNFDKYLNFAIDKKFGYVCRLRHLKTMYVFEVWYSRDIPKEEQPMTVPALPKDKARSKGKSKVVVDEKK